MHIKTFNVEAFIPGSALLQQLLRIFYADIVLLHAEVVLLHELVCPGLDLEGQGACLAPNHVSVVVEQDELVDGRHLLVLEQEILEIFSPLEHLADRYLHFLLNDFLPVPIAVARRQSESQGVDFLDL